MDCNCNHDKGAERFRIVRGNDFPLTVNLKERTLTDAGGAELVDFGLDGCTDIRANLVTPPFDIANT